MDIRKYAVEQTGRLHLRDASEELMYTDDGKEIAINVYSPGSKKFAKAQAAKSNRTLDILRKKGKSDQTAESIAEERATYLADCTESFENIEFDKLEGKALFKAVYADESLGSIADQVATYLGDWANFTKGSTKAQHYI